MTESMSDPSETHIGPITFDTYREILHFFSAVGATLQWWLPAPTWLKPGLPPWTRFASGGPPGGLPAAGGAAI